MFEADAESEVKEPMNSGLLSENTGPVVPRPTRSSVGFWANHERRSFKFSDVLWAETRDVTKFIKRLSSSRAAPLTHLPTLRAVSESEASQPLAAIHSHSRAC